MTIHIICLTSSGGLPLFNRKIGNCDSLSFSTVGSLNGVHMFCKSQGISLKTTHLNDNVIVWKEFEKSVTLIGAATNHVTETILRDLLELIFNVMVLFISCNEIKHNKNLERLTREIKNCYPIIDKLLQNTENGNLLKYSECIMSTNGQHILNKLNEFCEQFGSPFCCILTQDKIIIGTEGWWDLHVIDRKLLVTLFYATTTTTTMLLKKDIPVYLPKRSPNIAYRFVSCLLIADVYLCVLCGAQPTYIEIDNLAQQIWKNDLTVLQQISSQSQINRNLPMNLPLDTGILGIILINKIHSKYVIYENGQQLNTGGIGKRSIGSTSTFSTINLLSPIDTLHLFIHQSVMTIDNYLIDKKSSGKVNELKKMYRSNEAYWCTDQYKCYSYCSNDNNLICLIHSATIPIHSLRLTTRRTLNLILAEKDICW